MKMRWLPNSWIELTTDEGQVIDIDPSFNEEKMADYNIKLEKLPIADLILITHHHPDHCSRTTIDKIKKATTMIVATDLCAKQLDDEKIKIVKVGDELEYQNIKIKAVEAYNTPEGSSTKKFHKKGEGVGYIITVDGQNIYHAGDTDFITEMKELNNTDIAFLPVGGTHTMDMDEAAGAFVTLNPKVAIPMHFRDQDPNGFERKLEGYPNIKVIIPSIGQEYEL